MEALIKALQVLGMLCTGHRCVESCLLLRLTEAWQDTLHVGFDLTSIELSSRWEV